MMEANTNIITNKTAEYWDNEYKRGYIYGINPSEAAIGAVKLMKSRNIIKEGFRLLEIGGGYGRNAKYFAEQLDIPIKIVDISQRAIELGRKFTQNGKNCVEFILGNVEKLDELITDEFFDIVFHNFCLHLLDFRNRQLIYENVHKVLKTNGLFIGSYLSMNDSDFPKHSPPKDNTLLIRGKEQHYFSSDEIKKELQNIFDIDILEESTDIEEIINCNRNTVYFFVVGIKK